MSNSPIFDQLVTEFAAKGAVYEEFVRFTTPEFVWDPSRPVVQLDKMPKGKGIRFGKDLVLKANVLPTMVSLDVLQANGIEVEPNTEDNTLSLVVAGLHPTVKPLSERNTAQPTE